MPIAPEMKRLYPADWEAISLRIKQRAGWRCEFIERDTGERCRAVHGEPHPFTESKVVLTTAHLDHDPTNNDETNLRAGCQRCHLRWDMKQHVANAARRRREALLTGELPFG
jgi:hypothetical protein